MVWGDASLWYLLADANGMSGAEQLQAGRSLAIPDVISNVHNNAGTFRAYDATRAIGDVNPTTPKPVKNHHGCGIVGTLILVAIAVAVTAVTAGAAAAAATPGLSLIEGIGAFAAGTSGLSAGAAIAVGAGAGILGSVVSQGIGVATGLQQKFDWKSVAIAGITGAISGGLSKLSALANAGMIGGDLRDRGQIYRRERIPERRRARRPQQRPQPGDRRRDGPSEEFRLG
jgi:hypothetical protein